MTATEDLDVDVLMPVPAGPARALQNRARSSRGAKPWPIGLDERLGELVPRPTLVPYIPLPRRSTESATAAIATHLVRRSRASRPRLIHGSFLDEGGYAAAMLGRVLGAPSILVAHGSDVRAARGQIGGVGRKRRALAAIAKAHRVIAVSSRLAGDLALLGARAEVLPFTARAADFPLAAPMPGPPTILFVGRLTREKGIDVLLSAFARMKTRALLELVGPDPKDIDLEGECRRLGIADRVVIAGELPQGELPDRYAEAACLALPSRSEGLPCVVGEALLVGRPVVATDVGGVAELVDDRVGALVPPGDADAFALALDRTVARRFEPQILRDRALPMTWERVGPKLAEITRRLL